MLTRSRYRLIVFVGAFLPTACSLIVPIANAANIIDSTYGAGAGSFELGTYSEGPGGFMPLPPGASTITGWTVGGPGDGVDWLGSSTYKPDTGVMSVDLKDHTNSSISTVIPTISGAIYNLSFGAASVVGLDNTGVVSAGSLVNQPFAAPFSNHFYDQTFQGFTFQFTATGPTTTIQFMATGNNSPPEWTYGPAIDSVSVTATPEPSTLALLVAGAISLLVCAWRRRKRAP